MKTTALMITLLISTIVATASEEEFLGWTSAVIQCGKTPESGDLSCDIKIGGNGWEKFVIHAFGATHTLATSDLKKLNEFPLSSLRTSHEAGYEPLGGHTVHFRFNRTLYNSDTKLLTEIIYVSVTKKGVTVSDPRTPDHQAAASNDDKPIMQQVAELTKELAEEKGFSDQDATKVTVFLLEKLVGKKPDEQKLSTRIVSSLPDSVRVFAAHDFGIGFTGYDFEFKRGDPEKEMRWAYFHLLERVPSE